MSNDQPIFRNTDDMKWQPTRRDGIEEKRLLTPEDSPYQNVVLIKAEQGAEVEYHQIHTSESIYVLEGNFEVILPNSITKSLKPCELYHFPQKTWHGFRCTKGPGLYLVILLRGLKNNEKTK